MLEPGEMAATTMTFERGWERLNPRDRLAGRGQALRALCLVVGGLSPITAQPQEMGLETWFSSLRTGMWVKVEGPRTLDGVLQASKVKVYAGELDEVTVESNVAAVDVPRLTIQTSLGVRVVATPNTEMEGPKQQRHVSLAFLEVGDRIKIAGQLEKDGSLLAEEIDIEESSRLEAGLQPEGIHELTARIEAIDTARHRIVVLGLPIQLGKGTRMRSSLPD